MAYDASHGERFARDRAVGRGPETDGPRGRPTGETGHGWFWLFLLPFFGCFFPWIYNTTDPELFGLPFFYWYQMLWVPVTVVLTIIVYRKTRGS
jgi:uncharacterized protein DUF3311